MNTPLLAIEELEICAGNRTLLTGISFRLNDGKVLGLVGRSGLGKSTLVRAIVRRSANENVPGLTRGSIDVYIPRIGYCPQRGGLLPWFSVRKQLNSAMQLSGDSTTRGKFTEIIKRLDIESILDRSPMVISGGEYQRAVLALALLSNPQILILDEPLTAVDLNTKWTIIDFVETVLANGCTRAGLIITHDLDVLIRLSDTILVFSGPPMRLLKKISVTSTEKKPREKDWVFSPEADVARKNIIDALV